MINAERLLFAAHQDQIERLVVGAVIQNSSKLLLLERAKNDFMGGIYELPSGKVEDDEDLETALRREVEEETGISISNIDRYLGYFDYFSKGGKRTRQFNFLVSIQLPFRIKLQEHDNFVWVEIEKAKNYPVTEKVMAMLTSI